MSVSLYYRLNDNAQTTFAYAAEDYASYVDLLKIAAVDVYKTITQCYLTLRVCIVSKCKKAFYGTNRLIECRKCFLRSKIKKALKSEHRLCYLEAASAAFDAKSINVLLWTFDNYSCCRGLFDVNTTIDVMAQKWLSVYPCSTLPKDLLFHFNGEPLLHGFTLADYNILNDAKIIVQPKYISITLIDIGTFLVGEWWTVKQFKQHFLYMKAIPSINVQLYYDANKKTLDDDNRCIVSFGIRDFAYLTVKTIF